MGKELKIILLVLLAIFLILQFIPSGMPENSKDNNYNFITENNVPSDVGEMLKAACFDCHSQEVRYPWYSYVAPISWQVARDINMGREHLDFSSWDQLSKRKKIKMLGELSDEVSIGSMPMSIYILMHKEANLSSEQRDRLVSWADDLTEEVFEE